MNQFSEVISIYEEFDWVCISVICHTFCVCFPPKASHDKTSKACQRRRSYMLKQPKTRINVEIFVGEALQDKRLVKEFKDGQKYIRTNVEENVQRFRKLLSKLKEKFR